MLRSGKEPLTTTRSQPRGLRNLRRHRATAAARARCADPAITAPRAWTDDKRPPV
jgi:hypothetical protein